MAAPPPNVFYRIAIDFRDFDISVPSFSFQNDNFREIDRFNDTPITYDDQITLVAAPGSAQNNSFLGTSITRSGQVITGGTIDFYVDNRSGGFDGYIDFTANQPAVNLNAVIDSVSTADDRAFLRSMLAGDDVIELSGGTGSTLSTNDYVFSGLGDDIIYGNRGNDTLFGDSGLDTVYGDAGADLVYGGRGVDYVNGGFGGDSVFGGGGVDNLLGGTGADRLRGDAGNDSLAGGAGADQFVFRANHGADVIHDFEDGIDKIRIEAPGGSDLGTFVKTQVGVDTVITNTTLNIEITIQNINMSQITIPGDFILVAL